VEQTPPNRPEADIFPRLEELLNAYAKQLTTGPRAEAVKLVDEAMPDVAAALITAATAGGVMAIRLCFELSSHVPPDFHPSDVPDDDSPDPVVESPGER